MSINNREELNKYYNIINELVDNYVEKHKIRPSRLVSYLNPGSDRFNKFLSKNGLSEVVGADRILKDILFDRAGMEEDGVYTFESFKYFESDSYKFSSMKSCLYKGIDKTEIKSEKIIADYFDVNLGDIDVVDSEKHLFKVNDWNSDNWEVVVYSSEEVDIIITNVKEFLFDELNSQKIIVGDGVEVELRGLVDRNSFLEKISNQVSSENTFDLVSRMLGEDWRYVSKVGSHHLWTR